MSKRRLYAMHFLYVLAVAAENEVILRSVGVP